MITVYDGNGNVVDLSEWKKKIWDKAIDECKEVVGNADDAYIKCRINCEICENTLVNIPELLERLEEIKKDY